MNSDVKWITYDAKSNTAKITSIKAFVQHCKNATKSVGAFDDLNRAQAENMVFNNGQSKVDALHYICRNKGSYLDILDIREYRDSFLLDCAVI